MSAMLHDRDRSALAPPFTVNLFRDPNITMSIRTPLRPEPHSANGSRRQAALSRIVAAIVLLFPLAAVAQDATDVEKNAETAGTASATADNGESAATEPESSGDQDGSSEDADASQDAEQSETTADADALGRLRIELNRLEQLDGSCRVYLVFENALGTSVEALQLELVLFDSKGFIQRRLTLDAAPIAADKTSVKLFDLAETECDKMGRILVNDILKIAGPEGALPSDVAQLALSSKLDVDLFR